MSDVVDTLEWLANIAGREEAPPLFGRKEFFTRLHSRTDGEEFFPFHFSPVLAPFPPLPPESFFSLP